MAHSRKAETQNNVQDLQNAIINNADATSKISESIRSNIIIINTILKEYELGNMCLSESPSLLSQETVEKFAFNVQGQAEKFKPHLNVFRKILETTRELLDLLATLQAIAKQKEKLAREIEELYKEDQQEQQKQQIASLTQWILKISQQTAVRIQPETSTEDNKDNGEESEFPQEITDKIKSLHKNIQDLKAGHDDFYEKVSLLTAQLNQLEQEIATTIKTWDSNQKKHEETARQREEEIKNAEKNLITQITLKVKSKDTDIPTFASARFNDIKTALASTKYEISQLAHQIRYDLDDKATDFINWLSISIYAITQIEKDRIDTLSGCDPSFKKTTTTGFDIINKIKGASNSNNIDKNKKENVEKLTKKLLENIEQLTLLHNAHKSGMKAREKQLGELKQKITKLRSLSTQVMCELNTAAIEDIETESQKLTIQDSKFHEKLKDLNEAVDLLIRIAEINYYDNTAKYFSTTTKDLADKIENFYISNFYIINNNDELQLKKQALQEAQKDAIAISTTIEAVEAFGRKIPSDSNPLSTAKKSIEETVKNLREHQKTLDKKILLATEHIQLAERIVERKIAREAQAAAQAQAQAQKEAAEKKSRDVQALEKELNEELQNSQIFKRTFNPGSKESVKRTINRLEKLAIALRKYFELIAVENNVPLEKQTQFKDYSALLSEPLNELRAYFDKKINKKIDKLVKQTTKEAPDSEHYLLALSLLDKTEKSTKEYLESSENINKFNEILKQITPEMQLKINHEELNVASILEKQQSDAKAILDSRNKQKDAFNLLKSDTNFINNNNISTMEYKDFQNACARSGRETLDGNGYLNTKNKLDAIAICNDEITRLTSEIEKKPESNAVIKLAAFHALKKFLEEALKSPGLPLSYYIEGIKDFIVVQPDKNKPETASLVHAQALKANPTLDEQKKGIMNLKFAFSRPQDKDAKTGEYKPATLHELIKWQRNPTFGSLFPNNVTSLKAFEKIEALATPEVNAPKLGK